MPCSVGGLSSIKIKSLTGHLVVAWAGGNAIGPQLFRAKWAPRYFNTLYIHIGLYVTLDPDSPCHATLNCQKKCQT